MQTAACADAACLSPGRLYYKKTVFPVRDAAGQGVARDCVWQLCNVTARLRL